MHKFASPAKFSQLSQRVLPWCVVAFVATLGFGLWQALLVSPEDYQQGQTVRIMYVHVPAAWMSLGVYSSIALASASVLIWKHPLAALFAKASAPIGAVFTVITLITGSLWGKPMWGTWWEWDARLTSVLILLFIYIAYIALHNSYDGMRRGDKICAIFALIGFVNIPIIRFSVEWWQTLHQPASVIRAGGNAIDPSMQPALFGMAAAFMLLYVILVLLRMQALLIEQKIRRLQFSGV